jgi:hypothetical protein
MKALSAGGGGGLTAALCLPEIGAEIRVFESVETVRPPPSPRTPDCPPAPPRPAIGASAA